MKRIELSEAQQQGKTKVLDWYQIQRNNLMAPELPQPIFRLFGYAGTGKTTIIKDIIEELAGEYNIAFAAFTGKAAKVMREHGLPASTIHSLIYFTHRDPKTNQLWFRKRPDNSLAQQYDLIVLDECSMVNEKMLNDLLTFRIPMLVLGDPGQLPPIKGEGALIDVSPDVMLSEIHRQAADNPILQWATKARKGIPLPSRVKPEDAEHLAFNYYFRETAESLAAYDQILCGRNITRRLLNLRIREHLGYMQEEKDSAYQNCDVFMPQVGEKLICLRNDTAILREVDGTAGGDANRNINEDEEDFIPIFNGQQAIVLAVLGITDKAVNMVVELDTGEQVEVLALREHFELDPKDAKNKLEDKTWKELRDYHEFDFGYALTVHKSQGSQWKSVLFYDDGFYSWDPKLRNRWLYTGITRAEEKLRRII